jgi:hypothetical protein
MSDFLTAKGVIETLCRSHHLPKPRITEALPTDPCDFTSGDEIRLNCRAAKSVSAATHAAHVFGHWICCLHAEADERDGGAETCDLVATAIGDVFLTLAMHPDIAKPSCR